MTDDEAKALGLRAAARMGRWLPGVLAHHGDVMVRVTEVSDVGHSVIGTSYDEHYDAWRVARHPPRPDQWPDFRDPATLGCLLALVREAWAEAVRRSDLYEAQVVVVETRWGSCRRARWVVCPDGGRLGAIGAGATEAEALVAALEDAPTATPDP